MTPVPGSFIARSITFTLVLAIWLLVTTGLSPATAEPRVALVIGNADYGREMGSLINPANDAALMKSALTRAGFDVVVITDADQKAMKRAISDFGKRLTAAGNDVTALFYYSGHGLQVGGENYLIPVNAAIAAEADVDLEAVSADTILKQMQFADARVNIIILDACRNNPLPRGFRSAQMGLARMEAPRGSFVAYSTAPGEVASDGAGKNSPYTAALATAITTPGLSIEEAFRTVRGSVLTETGNTQTPWESSSLTAPFFFTPGSTGKASLGEAPAPPVAGAAQDTHTVEVAFWDSIKDSRDPADFTAYLDQYPQGSFAPLARNRLTALAAPAMKSQLPAEEPAQAEAPVAEDATQYASASPDAPGDPDAAAELCVDDSVDAAQRLAACRDALRKDGLDDVARADLINETGQAYYQLLKYREAAAAFREAMRLDPENGNYPANLGLTLSDTGKYREAIDAYNQALALDPQNVWHLYNRGFAQLNSGDAAKAAADLDSALAIDENFELLATRGFISLAEGDEKKAVDFTSRAIAYDPDGYNLQSIAILYLAERDADAISMIDRLAAKGEGYGYGQLWHALLLTRQGKKEAARTLLTQTLADHRDDWPGMLMRWMLGKYTEATLLSKAREGTKRDIQSQLCEAYFYLGERSYRDGRKDEAMAYFTKAVATKVYGYSEYQAASAFLRRLRPGG